MLDKLKVVCDYVKTVILTILGICVIMTSTIILSPLILYCKIEEAIEYQKIKKHHEETPEI